VEILTRDARRTGLPSGSFDLVHARNLLVDVPEPQEVVAEMVRLARPGGQVAALEPDTGYGLCYPPHPAFARICEIYAVAAARNGADPRIGRRVPELFRRAGLADVGVETRTQMYPPSNTRRTIRLTWCAACARRCWRWAWPVRWSLMSWMRRPVPISVTPTR
jgi:ubiquinone/menaquinone biosynthesis C-methylase UbiE